ncbi:MAG: helix-turn-helix transcriptional regulator, partial [Candidatus Bipolaricaulota bacterium]
DPYQLARKLLAARTRAGVTQQEVAAAMGTTRSAVSRLESPGKHSPSVKTLIKYARAVGCDIEIGLVPRPPKKKEARPADTRQKRAAGS